MKNKIGQRMNNMAKEKTIVTLARIDERVRALVEANTKDHKDFIAQVKDLCKHVNEEHEKYNLRLEKIEAIQLGEKNRYIGRLQFFKWLSAGLGAVLTIATILKVFGVL